MPAERFIILSKNPDVRWIVQLPFVTEEIIIIKHQALGSMKKWNKHQVPNVHFICSTDACKTHNNHFDCKAGTTAEGQNLLAKISTSRAQ